MRFTNLFGNIFNGNVVHGDVSISSSGASISGKSAGPASSPRVEKLVEGLSTFDKLEVTGPFDVEWEGSRDTEVAVKAEEHVLEYLDVHTRNGVLMVTSKPGSFSCSSPIVVSVRSPLLTDVSVKGSGDITMRGAHQAKLSANVIGSGDIRVDGSAVELTVQIKGSGDFKGRKLQATKASLSVMGSGDIDVNVHGDVTAVVMGSGDITVYGCKGTRSASVRGSGDISFE